MDETVPRRRMHYYPSFIPNLYKRYDVPIEGLVSALSDAPLYEQKMMLGEILYPLVDQLEHEHAAKVTGMILEKGTTEVLHLLESPTELRLMVAETMDVLRDVLNGETLYSLVDQLEHEHAAKVTGMLLEMDQTEVLHLLESPDALKLKVAEVMDVLRNVQQANSTSRSAQLASLSLNENLHSEMNGKTIVSKPLYVALAQRKEERRARLQYYLNGLVGLFEWVSLNNPTHKLVGWRLSEMNGKTIVSKPLYVALAQRKEERRARLQAQFQQMRPVAMAPSMMAPRMPMYPPGAPAPPAMIPPQGGFGYQQQLVPGMRPGGGPMPNFFVPVVQQGQQGQRLGGRRGTGPVQQNQQPVPMMQQQMVPRGRMYRGYSGRNVGGGNMGTGMLPVAYDMGGMLPRDAAAAMQQPMPIKALASDLANAPPEQQRTICYPVLNNACLAIYRLSLFKIIVMLFRIIQMLGENLYPLVDQLEHEHAAKVTGMLLDLDQTEVLHLLESPDALKLKMLGENLYPLVDQLEHEHAAKVTGMLLEMDQTEVLHLLESPDALKLKVAEAMDVLRNVQQANSTSAQLASLSLNENLVS
ncbi:poly(A) binding protein 2 [Artemisia annua]|uniref:Poly(A) binding protein 2 n=1 Tax=Artemisia annua TaxID=35608 RepID=A0A2U1P2I5_ARTAN|nr:poly(A) binding protein 2 [Artemisia annua]